MSLIENEIMFEKQIRSFLIAVNMLNLTIGALKLHESSNSEKRYEFNNEDVEKAIKKVYRAYDNIEINRLENIWNKEVINNLIDLIDKAQTKVLKAISFMESFKEENVVNKSAVLETLDYEYETMLDLKEDLVLRLESISFS